MRELMRSVVDKGAPVLERFADVRHGETAITWDTHLELKARLHISNRVSTIATPQQFLIVDKIPKTKSGKIMRRVLKARYLGTDTGDVSTMED